jgi:hypothetical protein
MMLVTTPPTPLLHASQLTSGFGDMVMPVHLMDLALNDSDLFDNSSRFEVKRRCFVCGSAQCAGHHDDVYLEWTKSWRHAVEEVYAKLLLVNVVEVDDPMPLSKDCRYRIDRRTVNHSSWHDKSRDWAMGSFF